MSDKNKKSIPFLFKTLIFMISIIIGMMVANLGIYGINIKTFKNFFSVGNFIGVFIISFIASILIVVTTDKMKKRKKI